VFEEPERNLACLNSRSLRWPNLASPSRLRRTRVLGEKQGRLPVSRASPDSEIAVLKASRPEHVGEYRLDRASRVRLEQSQAQLRVRLHRLKMRGKKCIRVLTLAQHLRSACGDECGISHANKPEYRSQIWLDTIERGHLRLSVVDAAGCDDEGRLLAEKQTLGCSVGIGKRPAYTANLVDL